MAQARRLRKRGLSLQEIADSLGVSTSTVGAWLPKTNPAPEDAISAEVLVQFIQSQSEDDPVRGLLVNGVAMESSLQRAYFRWRKEGAQPRLETVEKALFDLKSSFAQFEDWAQDHQLCVWLHGQAPSWWSDDSCSRLLEDLDSTDPSWRQEARIEGTELGMLDKAGRRPRRRQVGRVRTGQLLAA
jgi:predicted transcriptional regulator